MLPVLVALATTPTPANTPDDSLVTPGPFGFGAIAFIGVAVFLLVWDMLRRIRRGRYREEVNAELDAEEQARAAATTAAPNDDDTDPAAPRR
ncbi:MULTISPECIES: hypothetical protein [Microbacterium]|jgi:hypothetical protein|uniref:hypothetical protein n=1 Tax=Microbacterium TaxID=33882 RepID=UPI0023DA0B08|nr:MULTISPECIES: hypothetical protein [Microbacterium]MDF2045508.1 hypothetical protein [Microbacterium sp. Kw_RZR3]MDQ1076488.1 hypothetical protein [Microbacterium sp. SORGH_AS_0969]MDQ1116723.1 hypothetical protein [Microbacterium testaceum]